MTGKSEECNIYFAIRRWNRLVYGCNYKQKPRSTSAAISFHQKFGYTFSSGFVGLELSMDPANCGKVGICERILQFTQVKKMHLDLCVQGITSLPKNPVIVKAKFVLVL